MFHSEWTITLIVLITHSGKKESKIFLRCFCFIAAYAITILTRNSPSLHVHHICVHILSQLLSLSHGNIPDGTATGIYEIEQIKQ